MGATSQALGNGTSKEFAGKTWKLAPWTFGIQGEYEEYLERQALQKVMRQSKGLLPDDAKEVLRTHWEMIAARAITWGSPIVTASLQNVDNLKYLLWLQLKDNHPDVPLQLAQEMFDENRETIMDLMKSANPTTAETETT